MFKLIKNGPEGSDCTALYIVQLDKEYTVREFVKTVLSNDKEWGYIGIHNGESFFGNPKCEYRYGKLLSFLPKELRDKKVKSAEANGGWSYMSYLLVLEE